MQDVYKRQEIEMVYVAEGRLELKIPSESFYVETGDAFVINSNVLHYAIAADYCKLHSLVFHPTLILGNEDSVFAKKYVRPLVSCHAFSGCAVSRFENAHVIQWFCSAFDAIVQEMCIRDRAQMEAFNESFQMKESEV